ncbi:hypothetical protein PVAP13_4NG022781 [Panicum virgatum]|uniref:Uncharacterized protein n=1 Tax=Panicum virgatum TaxID=38727 RepID=A0A8T0SWM3_PANVG|nr:hypothetical protein PVAP13_4NG022781 [Panicum virgatum]
MSKTCHAIARIRRGRATVAPGPVSASAPPGKARLRPRPWRPARAPHAYRRPSRACLCLHLRRPGHSCPPRAPMAARAELPRSALAPAGQTSGGACLRPRRTWRSSSACTLAAAKQSLSAPEPAAADRSSPAGTGGRAELHRAGIIQPLRSPSIQIGCVNVFASSLCTSCTAQLYPVVPEPLTRPVLPRGRPAHCRGPPCHGQLSPAVFSSTLLLSHARLGAVVLSGLTVGRFVQQVGRNTKLVDVQLFATASVMVDRAPVDLGPCCHAVLLWGEPARCSEQSILCPAARPHGSPARELELRRCGRSRAGAAAREEDGGGATAGAEPGLLRGRRKGAARSLPGALLRREAPAPLCLGSDELELSGTAPRSARSRPPLLLLHLLPLARAPPPLHGLRAPPPPGCCSPRHRPPRNAGAPRGVEPGLPLTAGAAPPVPPTTTAEQGKGAKGAGELYPAARSRTPRSRSPG